MSDPIDDYIRRAAAIIAIIGAVVLAGCSTASAPNPPDQTPTPDWQPAGYKVYPGDTSIAFRFQAASEYSCSFGRCTGMEFVSRDGCPNSLYVELSLSDSSGASVGFTNDVSGALLAGQHAKLVFDILEESAKKVRVTDVTCN